MSQLSLFWQDIAQAKRETFPCEYDPHFLSQPEADAFFTRFVNFPFCARKTIYGHLAKRRGVGYVSDVNHPQVMANYNRRTGKKRADNIPVVVEEDGCVGDVGIFNENTPDEVKRLRDKLSARIDRDVNYISVQIYPDGASQINWHRHSEDDGIDTPVLIVSTGEERDFHVRRRDDYSKHWNRPAQHGSLIIMPAEFNDTHHHAILPDRSKRPRISINTKCLIAPRVYDCHKGERYPSSRMPELHCPIPAVYVGCTVKSQRDGSTIRQGTIYGNGVNPLKGHHPMAADTEESFRRYAETRMLEPAFRAQAIKDLRGRHLLCWCKQDGSARSEWCHARVWLDIVNRQEMAV